MQATIQSSRIIGDELAENVSRSGGMDQNVATNHVGKTSRSNQSAADVQ